MTKKLTRSKNIAKFPAKNMSWKEIKDVAITNIQGYIYPGNAVKELAAKLPYMPYGSHFNKRAWKNMCSVGLTYGIESGLMLAENTPKRYRSFALQMKRDLENEFDCKNICERALVDQIVTAHIRMIDYSYRLNKNQDFEFYGNARNNYFFFLSREIDRASRQFNSGIETLRNLKQPEMNIKLNIKSKNTFLANNQQINKNNESK